jgi:glycosyltransferase involved in cell wall biosynthesis
MLAFLLAKPTQFDAPFFAWWQKHMPQVSFCVFYWQPVGTSADTDTETGASLNWGIPLLEGYSWQQADPGNAVAFGEQLAKLQVHYLISNGWKQGFAPLLQAARSRGITTGLRIDSVLWQKSPIELLIRRVVLRKAYSRFSHFFSSGAVGDAFLDRMGIPKIQWGRWPYVVDEQFFAPSAQHQAAASQLRQQWHIDDRPVILAVCKWNNRENPLELLQALQQTDASAWQVIMIGDGPLRKHIQQWQQQHPEVKLILPGYVPYVQLPQWYAVANVLVHPAAYEPWGVSVHEALSAGCVVVASSRVGSAYDLIEPGKNGYIYEAGLPAELAAYLPDAIQLAAKQNKRQSIMHNGRFTYKAVVTEIAAIVKEHKTAAPL